MGSNLTADCKYEAEIQILFGRATYTFLKLARVKKREYLIRNKKINECKDVMQNR